MNARRLWSEAPGQLNVWDGQDGSQPKPSTQNLGAAIHLGTGVCVLG